MRTQREPVVTTRAVRVECIPDGRPADLPPGTPPVEQALVLNGDTSVVVRLAGVAGAR